MAKRIFKLKYKKLNFDNLRMNDTVEARKVFRTFGPLICELKISNPTGTMDAIIRYCTSLKSLILRSYAIPDNKEKIVGMGALFRKLYKLYMKNVGIEDSREELDNPINYLTPSGNSMDFFVNCNSLITFVVVESYDLERVLLSSRFPRLKHFRCDTESPNFSNEIEGFITNHKNLKTFCLENFENDDHVPVLKAIADCKNLEVLELGFQRLTFTPSNEADTSLKNLQRLQCLTELTITFTGDQLTNLVKELPKLPKLEVLDIKYASGIPELIPVVSQLKQLRIFRLHDCSTLPDINQISELSQLIELSFEYVETDNFDLIKIVRGLISLRKLIFIVNTFKISKTVYMGLVAVVECRPASHRALEIICPTTEDFNDLPQATVKLSKLE